MMVWVIAIDMPGGAVWYCGKKHKNLSISQELGDAINFGCRERAVEYLREFIRTNPGNLKFNSRLVVRECYYDANEDTEACSHLQ